MLSVEEAQKQKILEKLIETHPGTLNDPEGLLVHSRDSAFIIGEVLDKVTYNYPEEFKFTLDRREIEIAAYLHDIGRILQKDQAFHGLRGAKYIEEEGTRLGISLTEKHEKQLYRIAETIRSHLVAYEQFLMPEYKEKRKEFENLDPDLLIPTTWNQKFLVYAELSNVNSRRVSPQERLMELEKRYSKDTKYQDKLFFKAFMKGKERLFRVCNTVDRLIQGRMDEREIKRYGFLM